MKTKGGKPDELETDEDQTISDMCNQARKLRELIINKNFEEATRKLTDKLKEFSQVRLLYDSRPTIRKNKGWTLKS